MCPLIMQTRSVIMILNALTSNLSHMDTLVFTQSSCSHFCNKAISSEWVANFYANIFNNRKNKQKIRFSKGLQSGLTQFLRFMLWGSLRLISAGWVQEARRCTQNHLYPLFMRLLLSNLQDLLQKVDISGGALRAILQGFTPQFLTDFRVICCLL